jgi:hypothetical protein
MVTQQRDHAPATGENMVTQQRDHAPATGENMVTQQRDHATPLRLTPYCRALLSLAGGAGRRYNRMSLARLPATVNGGSLEIAHENLSQRVVV